LIKVYQTALFYYAVRKTTHFEASATKLTDYSSDDKVCIW